MRDPSLCAVKLVSKVRGKREIMSFALKYNKLPSNNVTVEQFK